MWPFPLNSAHWIICPFSPHELIIFCLLLLQPLLTFFCPALWPRRLMPVDSFLGLLYLLSGFSQWEAVLGGQEAGRKRGWDISNPLPLCFTASSAVAVPIWECGFWTAGILNCSNNTIPSLCFFSPGSLISLNAFPLLLNPVHSSASGPFPKASLFKSPEVNSVSYQGPGRCTLPQI